MERQCILCEVGIDFLNIIYMNFRLQRVKPSFYHVIHFLALIIVVWFNAEC